MIEIQIDDKWYEYDDKISNHKKKFFKKIFQLK